MVEMKAGLEIHQQLDTRKLFSHAPSVLHSFDPVFEVRRTLHAVAGESGEVDVAAKHAVAQDREYVYQGYEDTTLVELDEEPPYEINPDALHIGLHIALLLGCEVLPVTQIMRKTVVDGSNTSGFQRTVLIARNGSVTTSHGTVRIASVALEEDSARRIEERERAIVFRLDRLGIPLIEIATEPDMRSPEQCKEVALHIGEVLRSCPVRRGIGTIRQDINVSTPGHPRVEIKGFQDVDMFIPVVKEEIARQHRAVAEGNVESAVRGAQEDGSTRFLRPMPGAARMYPETDLPLLMISRDMMNEAKKTLPRLRRDIAEELEKQGLSSEMVSLVLKADKLEEYRSLVSVVPDPGFIAKVLVVFPKEFARKDPRADQVLHEECIAEIVKAVATKSLAKQDVKEVMADIVSGMSLEEAIAREKADSGEVESRIAEIIRKKPGLSVGGYMGLVMKEFKGKISGKEVQEILKKLLS